MLMMKIDGDEVTIQTDKTNAKDLIVEALWCLNALLMQIQNQVGEETTQQLLSAYLITADNFPINNEMVAEVQEALNKND